MSRLFVYDENMTDERAKITVAKMAAMADIVAPEKKYITYTRQGVVTVSAGCVIAVGDSAVFETTETELTKANLDQGSDFEHGKDYYIYICDTGNDANNEVYIISENSTFPDGEEWDDENTRKIGGFHYGRVRNVNDLGQAVNSGGSVRGSGSRQTWALDFRSLFLSALRSICLSFSLFLCQIFLYFPLFFAPFFACQIFGIYLRKFSFSLPSLTPLICVRPCGVFWTSLPRFHGYPLIGMSRGVCLVLRLRR